MKENLIIKAICRIKDKKIFLDREIVFHAPDANNFSEFSKATYKSFNLAYPNFFKMDNLSKLGFLAADVLLKKCDTYISDKPDETGIIITNASSSLDTDFKYFDSIKDSENYFPSPSVFVYTLPNIMIGEICIKHKITGESAFFVSEKFDPDFIYNYVTDLFSLKKVRKCLTGWVELMDEKYDCVFYLIERVEKEGNGNIKFNPENISEIYNK